MWPDIWYCIIQMKYLVAPEFYQAKNFNWQAGFTFYHYWLDFNDYLIVHSAHFWRTLSKRSSSL